MSKPGRGRGLSFAQYAAQYGKGSVRVRGSIGHGDVEIKHISVHMHGRVGSTVAVQCVRLSMGRRYYARSVGDFFKPHIGGVADLQNIISLRNKRKRETGLAVANFGLSSRGLIVSENEGESR